MKEKITLALSIIAMILGIINFIINARSKKKANELQKRKDEIELDDLLDNVFDCLYAKDGYINSKEKIKLFDAQSMIKKAKKINDKYSRVIEFEGLCLEAEGKKEKALEKYKTSLELKPIRWQGYQSIGLLSKGEEAISMFEKAIKIKPKEAGKPLYNIGKALVSLGQLNEAEKKFNESLNFLPHHSLTHFELAKIYRKKKEINKAIKSFEKAISLNPHYIDSIVDLGNMLAENGEWERGINWIEQAIRINPVSGYPFAKLFFLYANKKDSKNALKYYNRAVEIDPEYGFSDSELQRLKIEMEKINK